MTLVDPAQRLSPIPALAAAPLPTLGTARRLMLLLATGQPAIIPKLKDAFAGRMSLAEVWAEVEPVAVTAVRDAATALANALGADLGAVLQFCRFDEEAVEFLGRHGIVRRLDRVWGGPMLTGLEAVTEMHYVSPPCHYARWLVTQGAVWLHRPEHPRSPGISPRARVMPYVSFQLAPGQEFVLPPGAAVLVRRSPLCTLLKAVHEAGLPVGGVTSTAAGALSVPIPTPAGPLSLDSGNRVARLNQRDVRLTESECKALGALCNPPGAILARAALAAHLGLSQARNVDRIIVQLRNKLGDGLITTIYGAGYLLETARATVRTAVRPDSAPF